MADMVQSYLSRLQTGYRIDEYVTPSDEQPVITTLVPYNPYRVALYLSGNGSAQPRLYFRLPSGFWVLWEADGGFRMSLNWTNQQHLVYQEWGYTKSGGGTIAGFGVVKT